mgnify:CR=1 FL=1
MPFSIERNDLASVSADVIIVAANEDLQITGGVGKAVALKDLQKCDIPVHKHPLMDKKR